MSMCYFNKNQKILYLVLTEDQVLCQTPSRHLPLQQPHYYTILQMRTLRLAEVQGPTWLSARALAPTAGLCPNGVALCPAPYCWALRLPERLTLLAARGCGGHLARGPRLKVKGRGCGGSNRLYQFLTPRSPSPKQPPRPRAGRLLSRLQSPEGPRCPCRWRHRLFGAGVPALLPNLGAANPGPSVAPREPGGGQLHPGLPSASARPRGRLGAGGGWGGARFRRCQALIDEKWPRAGANLSPEAAGGLEPVAA